MTLVATGVSHGGAFFQGKEVAGVRRGQLSGRSDKRR
jgi:hypothetical protein